MKRRTATLLLTAMVAAWLGGAADSALMWSHDVLRRNIGRTAREWADAESTDADAESGPTTRPAAVVLGYVLSADGSASPALAARAQAGADLYDSGAVSTLIFSGGHPGGGLRGGRSEAAAAAAAAAAHLRLPSQPPAWRLEEASTSTWENALFSLRMLKEDDTLPPPSSVIVVTSPFHAGRAARTFAAAAARVFSGDDDAARRLPTILSHSPPLARPASPADRAAAAYEAVREIAALVLYWVRGRLL
jgi:hypothetical protein